MKRGKVNDEEETHRGSEIQRSHQGGLEDLGRACQRCEGLCRGSGWWSWELGDGKEVTARLARVWKA